MKIKVKTTQGGGMFGGGPSSEVDIEAPDYEAGQATVSVLSILAQNGIGQFPGGDGDDTSVGETSESIPPEAFGEETDAPYDPKPAAGWADEEDESPDPVARISEPGDAVRLYWNQDGSSRLFIDAGTHWVSPAVAGKFNEPLSIEFNDSNVTAQVVASLGDSLGLRDGQE
ncbi:hypothetical protein PBI_TEAMOCIL_66 [Microbacterium phage Teamocil]|uniref:Uncharacterized protein n=1 Tax=Microbacterium phage Teamocil TaxID=2656554 RepID=A0A649VXR8_9CAUD|nr:hypothetical protein QDA12_gp66 [Microbacterium phage Teamocil]QGJ88917.1 hypothetical protein PBI_GINA_66 [Microbacterium phage Gina]QGJ97014.1 hypothetical protein PBI_TEAMOCIL_66 [Microbacterium phage Teamocil]